MNSYLTGFKNRQDTQPLRFYTVTVPQTKHEHTSLGGKQRTQHHKNTQRRKRCSFKQKQNRPQGGTAEPYRQQQFSYLCGCIIHKTFKISCCPWAEICIQYCARNQMPAGNVLATSVLVCSVDVQLVTTSLSVDRQKGKGLCIITW